ncbi:MAG TPA: HEAT repeat domain-containing protein, partial [Planctomycetota bacterium]|nr:HEAT repeat domain-containing protein [Planctomycetota bacterium]
MDAAVPTYAGEILHSPAPSSIHVRLPGGGRLETGPSSWLSVGADGEFALLEGALTASADPSGRLVVEVPGAVVTATGEVEVSARTPSGAKSAEGARWLGSWAAARAKDATPGTPEAPAAALVVYARRGPVEFAASPGPVRNSLERTVIPEGHALVVLEKKVYRVAASLQEAMPEQTGWLEGMPVPPDSKFFRGVAPAGAGPAPAPPPHLGTGGGPVRNSLERTLADRDREAERRAYALSIYDSVGGAEAVAAAAGVVDDPAVLVRSAAVRVLALNAWADRERACVALRKLARDPDAGVARFAILAIRYLGDRGAIPDLKSLVVDDDAPPDSPAVVDDDAPPDSPAVVDDDAPPEKPSVMPDGREYRGPRTVAQVYAFDALVYFGDTSALPKAAELVPKVAGDGVLTERLQSAIMACVQRMDREQVTPLLSSPVPGVRAAALRLLGEARQ